MFPVKSPEEVSAPDAGKQDKIVVEMDEAEELPPGWRKEVKRRKTGSAKKVDRYYTDPVTGYVFRSLKDAQRYIKTGKLGRLAIKPKMTEKEPSEINEPTDKSELRAHASEPLAVINNDSVPAPPSPPPSQTKTRQATQLAEVAVDALPPLSPPDTKTNHQATRQSGNKIDASISSPSPAAVKTRQAARQAGIKIDSPPSSPPDSKTRQAKRVTGTGDNASPQLPKTRRATRQSGIKINSPPLSPPDTRRLIKSESQKITDKPQNQIADLNANPNHNQENSVTIHPLNQARKEHDKEIEMGPAKLPPSKDQPPPTVVPPLNLQKQEFPVVNPATGNPIPQASYGYGNDMKPDSSINFSMNDLWTDPCIEFAVKTLTGVIPVTDLNKVENFTAPLQVPVQDIWTDPCIEFAVKTLTGAIPVGEDDHLLHRPASSTNPQRAHQFSSHDFGYQTDVFSKHYETGHKNKQQVGNGGLQKSGKFVNGQSSRSRFFQ